MKKRFQPLAELISRNRKRAAAGLALFGASAAAHADVAAMIAGFNMDEVKAGVFAIGAILLGVIAIIVAVKIVLGMVKGGV